MNSFLINPFERIGVLHNQGLDYVVKKIPDKPDIYEIIRIISEYTCSLLRPGGAYSENELLQVSGIVSYAINHLNDIKTVYKDANLNETQIILLEKILSVNPYVKLENQYENFRELEFEVFNYPMSYKDKEILLIGTAIGKHSALYWTEVVKNPKNAWHKWLPDPNQPRYPLSKKKWANEDAKGAVSGAIGGAAPGLVTGGGVLVGALVGAVAGAIGSSVASALFD